MSENKEFQKVLDKAKALESINFAEDSGFNHEEYFSVIEQIAKQNQTIKDQEAEVVIQQQGANYINEEFITELENKKQTLMEFVRKYDPNKSDFLTDMAEHDIDKLYAISNYLLNAYIQYVNEMDFNLELSNAEVKYINNLLMGEIEYNGDEVFNFVQLLEDFWTASYAEYEADKSKETYVFKVSIKKILILHHLIKDHKVKGRTTGFKLFRNILYKIAQTNKVFNAYSIVIERIKSERELWGNALNYAYETLHPPIMAEDAPIVEVKE